jgi:hypothetical protein
MVLPNLPTRAVGESQHAATISAFVTGSATTTKPAVSEAAPANASLQAPMLLSIAVAAGGTGSAATEPAVVSEAAPASASLPTPVRMSLAAGVRASVPAPTDSAVAEATAAAANSSVADLETTPTSMSLPQLEFEQLELASQPPEASLSDQPLWCAFVFDFLPKQALS